MSVEMAETLDNVAGNTRTRDNGERVRALRGPRPVRARHCDSWVTSEIHGLAANVRRNPSVSVKPKRWDLGSWKSEAVIVAAKSGNADGAKDGPFRIMRHGTMDQTLCWTAP
jgi:hypothetical protein